MTHTYTITGMTCGNCVAKAKSALLMLGDVTEAAVQLSTPQATISMQKHIATATMQQALSKAGNYTIMEAHGGMQHAAETTQTGWLQTYKPILLIGAFILGTTLLLEAARGTFRLDTWMANFMAAFFLTFSFFKLLDVKGFAESYATYDVVAKRWKGWGLIYPFVELTLGLLFLLRIAPLLTNGVTFVVMAISIIGVLQSVLRRRAIQCACLGTVFKLPMSTITLIEDGLMLAMSATMIGMLV